MSGEREYYKLALKASKNAHLFRIKDTEVVCAYNSEVLIPVFFHQRFVEILLSKIMVGIKTTFDKITGRKLAEAKHHLKELCEAQIFLPADYDEQVNIERERELLERRVCIQNLSLIIDDGFDRRMKFRTFKQAIMMMRANLIKAFGKGWISNDLAGNLWTLSLEGRDPLLNNFEVISRGLDYISSYNFPPANIEISAGRGHITKAMIRSLLNRKVTVKVRIDGQKETHDKINFGTGINFRDSLRAFEKIRKNWMDPLVVYTLSRDNINSFEKDIRWLLKGEDKKGLGILKLHIDARDSFNSHDSDYRVVLRDKVINVYRMIKTEFPRVFEQNLAIQIFHHVKGLVRSGCNACGQKVTVDIDSNISICKRKEMADSIFTIDPDSFSLNPYLLMKTGQSIFGNRDIISDLNVDPNSPAIVNLFDREDLSIAPKPSCLGNIEDWKEISFEHDPNLRKAGERIPFSICNKCWAKSTCDGTCLVRHLERTKSHLKVARTCDQCVVNQAIKDFIMSEMIGVDIDER